MPKSRPRAPAPTPPEARLLQIHGSLAQITHELHIAEREVKAAHPRIAALLRVARTLVTEIRSELYQASPPSTKR